MMTSTFPTGRNNSRFIKNGLKEIQAKKESLSTLEAALKKRINEFRELCLKEGELTGHLPADYPLQPREPIPQVRRRLTRSSGNIYINGSAFNGAPLTRHLTVKATVEEPPKLSDLTNGVAKFQPYYEETKPFQMSDFYKYSSKHRQRAATSGQLAHPQLDNQVKTTRQLQDDVSRAKNSQRFAACDDQIQQSVRLIERSGQKLSEATAKAIADNPSLAERLNNILPTNHNNSNSSSSIINNNNHHHPHHLSRNLHNQHQRNGGSLRPEPSSTRY